MYAPKDNDYSDWEKMEPNLKEKWKSANWYIPPNHFEKWQACGNDFLLMSEPIQNLRPSRICDRHFGIGADGIIYVLPPTQQADVRMKIINANGTEAEMCGNGIRCLGRFVSQKIGKSTLKVETAAGIKEITVDGLDVRVDMGKVTPHWNSLINLPGREYDAFYLDIGNPHCVLLVNDTEEGEVEKYGQILENARDTFPHGVNVEFLEIRGRKHIRVKVWERGCGRTLGCGTGACAAAVVAKDRDLIDDIVTVNLDGGDVEVNVTNFLHGNIFLAGMAHYVYRGEIYPPED